jgi:hypothetical protein
MLSLVGPSVAEHLRDGVGGAASISESLFPIDVLVGESSMKTASTRPRSERVRREPAPGRPPPSAGGAEAQKA